MNTGLNSTTITLLLIILLILGYLMISGKNKSRNNVALDAFKNLKKNIGNVMNGKRSASNKNNRKVRIYNYNYNDNDNESIIIANSDNSLSSVSNYDIQNVIDDVDNYDSNGKYKYNETVENKNWIQKEQTKSNFLPNLWHNDYRDVITAIMNITPKRKQKFNLSNRPVKYYSHDKINKLEAYPMINYFINYLNDEIINHVPSERNKNEAWDSAVTDPNVESGWGKSQKVLGIDNELYNKDACKSKVKLISIKNIIKYETEDERKYQTDLVLQKLNVDDQIIVQVNLIQDLRDLKNEDNFFLEDDYIMPIFIEEIFIQGFLSDLGNDAGLSFPDNGENELFEFKRFDENNIVNYKEINKQLMEKYKNRTYEMEQRNAMLDEEGQEFHKSLPHVYDYSNIQNTQTIFDDYNNPSERFNKVTNPIL